LIVVVKVSDEPRKIKSQRIFSVKAGKIPNRKEIVQSFHSPRVELLVKAVFMQYAQAEVKFFLNKQLVTVGWGKKTKTGSHLQLAGPLCAIQINAATPKEMHAERCRERSTSILKT